MDLLFLGRGSAFNSKEGCTAAYFIEGRRLFLIDCGGSVFGALQQSGILEQVDNATIFITHTHSDHIGSLGVLIDYFYIMKQTIPQIVFGFSNRHLDKLSEILIGSGVPRQSFPVHR